MSLQKISVFRVSPLVSAVVCGFSEVDFEGNLDALAANFHPGAVLSITVLFLNGQAVELFSLLVAPPLRDTSNFLVFTNPRNAATGFVMVNTSWMRFLRVFLF